MRATHERGLGGDVLVAVTGVAVTSSVIALIQLKAHLVRVDTLFLLLVLGVAWRFGQRAALLSSALAYLAFDYLFTEPRYNLGINDPEEWLALVQFLVAATLVGHLTARLRAEARAASRREREASAMAAASWAVASQPGPVRALGVLLDQALSLGGVRAAAVLARREDGGVNVVAQRPEGGSVLPDCSRGDASETVAGLLSRASEPAWRDSPEPWAQSADGGDGRATYWPLAVDERVVGVLLLATESSEPLPAESARVLSTLAHHAGLVLDRDRLTRAETLARGLAEADRLKTALLSMISHDFRSPLASIKAGATSLLQEGAPVDREQLRGLLAGMSAEVDRLNRMVQNILAMSRLEADAWRPQCEWTPTAEVVGAALTGLTASEDQRVEVTLAPEPSELWCDAVQLAEVLHNLVDNALKYSAPPAPVEVSVGWLDGRPCLEVRDRGPGLPPGDEERIFEPFYRAPGLSESAVAGLGLGLTVCRGLALAHGASLTACPRAGGGSLFRVLLPAALGDNP